MDGNPAAAAWADWHFCVLRSISSHQEEEVTLCMEPESATLTPPTQQGDASGGSSPGQPPAEPVTEWKASDVTSGLVQTLEEQDEEGPATSVANNWVPGCQETPYYKPSRSQRGRSVIIQYISINLFLFRYENHNFLVARRFLQNGDKQIWKQTQWDMSWCNKGHLFLCKPYIPKVTKERSEDGETDKEEEEEEEGDEGEDGRSTNWPRRFHQGNNFKLR